VKPKAVSKRDRQGAILELVRRNRVNSQMELRTFLVEQGIEVTQATLSRDMKELRLVKVPDAGGGSHYTLSDGGEHTPPLESLLPTLFLSAEGTGNLIVIRTMTGGAQAVALGIDWEEWPGIMGSIAGDDTILLILREEADQAEILQRLAVIAGSD
jgi:transcriptional regulator of arginine metabolism